jgi:hypothetical protein
VGRLIGSTLVGGTGVEPRSVSVFDLFPNRAVVKPNFYSPIGIIVFELDPDPIPRLVIDFGLKSWGGADGIE